MKRSRSELIIILYVILALGLMLFVRDSESAEYNNFVPNTQVKEDALVRSIYKAEGSRKASKPYGIMMEKCSWDNVSYCKLAAQQTVRNNIKRWKKADDGRDYLTFLRDRYAPIGANNDPTGLNNHWLNNVKQILGKALGW